MNDRAERVQVLLNELASLDRPCGREMADAFYRLDCMARWPRWPNGGAEPWRDANRHSERCQQASRLQKTGFVYESDEHWRKYFVWKAEHEMRGITYEQWLDETGEQDPEFRVAHV